LRFVYWLVTALLALIVADFAVSNRAAVTLSFWPVSDSLTTELFVPVLVALVGGFLLGLLVAWVWSWRVRRRARQHARRVAVLEREAMQREERRPAASGTP
jgi:lipopolysaccharide assembly protein A